MIDTKPIAEAASRARRAVNQVREGNDYLRDRGHNGADFLDQDDDGNYEPLTDIQLAEIDGGADEALTALEHDGRDKEIAAEEAAAVDEFQSNGPDEAPADNAAVDGDESPEEAQG